MSSSLSAFQQQFIENIYRPETEHSLLKHILAEDIEQAKQLFQIYRGSTFGGLISVCQAVFPVVESLVGKKFFEKLIEQFILAYPLRTNNLNLYAAELPDFIADFVPAKSLPYLADVARLELAYQRVCLAAASPTFNAERMANLSEAEQGRIIFHLAPSLEFLHSDYPVFSLWQWHQQGCVGDPPDVGIQAEQGVLWRPELEPYSQQLSVEEYAALYAMQDLIEFADICDAFSGIDWQQFLSQCITIGLIVDFHLGLDYE